MQRGRAKQCLDRSSGPQACCSPLLPVTLGTTGKHSHMRRWEPARQCFPPLQVTVSLASTDIYRIPSSYIRNKSLRPQKLEGRWGRQDVHKENSLRKQRSKSRVGGGAGGGGQKAPGAVREQGDQHGLLERSETCLYLRVGWQTCVQPGKKGTDLRDPSFS